MGQFQQKQCDIRMDGVILLGEFSVEVWIIVSVSLVSGVEVAFGGVLCVYSAVRAIEGGL